MKGRDRSGVERQKMKGSDRNGVELRCTHRQYRIWKYLNSKDMSGEEMNVSAVMEAKGVPRWRKESIGADRNGCNCNEMITAVRKGFDWSGSAVMDSRWNVCIGAYRFWSAGKWSSKTLLWWFLSRKGISVSFLFLLFNKVLYPKLFIWKMNISTIKIVTLN